MAGGRRAGRGFLLRPNRPVLVTPQAGTPNLPLTVQTALDLKWSAVVSSTVPVTSVITDDEDAWTIPLEWSCLIDVDPVEDPPPSTDPYIEQASVTMPTPTLVNGRPQLPWTPAVTRSDWGRLQFIIDGHDRSRPRGIRFQPLSDAHTEPFGDGEAAFAFPGLTEFDDPAAWGIVPLAPVRLRRKDPGGTFHTLYEGHIASVEPDTGQGVVVACVGSLYRTDLLKEPPALVQDKEDYGRIIARAFNRKRRDFALHLGEMGHVSTGIYGVPPADFSPFLLGFVQNCLAEMNQNGDAWTVSLHRPRKPVLELKDTTTVNATVSYGAPGVSVSMTLDFTSATTAVYGTGANGHCQWMGARFPNLVEGSTPTFPLAVGATFSAGDGQGGFAPFAAFLRRGQYGTIVSDDTYAADDFDNVEQFQDRAGITVDGIVGAQTWEAAFQPGANQGSIRGAYVDTIWEKPATRRRLYNAQGADVGPNPNFDATIPRIEDYIPFGDNVSKSLGRKSAKQTVRRNYPAGRQGTITLTTDPAEMHRFDLKAGMNILVQNYNGASVLVHIIRRDRDWQAGTVTLTVDEKSRDLLTAAAIHQRRKDVADLTRRERFGKRNDKIFNAYGTWLCEDGAGEIPLMNQQGGFWNVQRIAAAPKGTLERVSLALGSGLTEHLLNVNMTDHPNATIPGGASGAMAIFAEPVTANALANLLGNPLLVDGAGQNPWDREADTLDRWGMIYAAGGPGAQIGYFPGNDPGDGTGVPTGRHEDAGGVQFGPTGRYWLWVAIYSSASCIVGGRLFPGAP